MSWIMLGLMLYVTLGVITASIVIYQNIDLDNTDDLFMHGLGFLCVTLLWWLLWIGTALFLLKYLVNLKSLGRYMEEHNARTG